MESTKAPEMCLWYQYAAGQKYHCAPVMQAHRYALCGAYSPEVNPPLVAPDEAVCCVTCLRLLSKMQRKGG